MVGCLWEEFVTLKPDKFMFAEDIVEFAGFEMSLNTVHPCEKYFIALRDFPTPENITDIRSWFGLVNQESYTFSTISKMLPFQQFLKPSNDFYRDSTIDNLFEECKLQLVKEIRDGVQIFDKNKPTCLATDWSKSGIGLWLSQKHCNCSGSRPSCCRIGWKSEALAVADALDKARYFMLGCSNLTIAVDHKPLIKILSDRLLEDIPNTRLRNLKERTLL